MIDHGSENCSLLHRILPRMKVTPVKRRLMLHPEKRRIVIDGRNRNESHWMLMYHRIPPSLKVTQKNLRMPRRPTFIDAILIAIKKSTLGNRFPRM
jgi:hypothetical protein